MLGDTKYEFEVLKPHSNWFNTDLFSFDHMKDQLDWIQQANSNYEETNLHSLSHSSTQSFEEKSEESPDLKLNQDMLKFWIYELRILRIIK